MIDRREFKGSSILKSFKNVIEFNLKDFEDYLHEVSFELTQKQKQIQDDYNSVNIDNEDDEIQHSFYSSFEEYNYKYFKTFPIYTFNPLLLTLYSQFELWLKKLCDLHHNRGLSNIKVKDLAGNNYIEKSRKYLELIAEIDISSLEPVWKKITDIQKLRNCIAHNNSNIIQNDAQSINNQYLYNHVLVEKDNIEFNKETGYFYIINKNYLLKIIKLIKTYLFDLIEKLEGKKVIAKNIAMPYDNAKWGQEKSESLLIQIIDFLDDLDRYELRKDEDKDLIGNIKTTLESMTYNITKIYSFFSNGSWNNLDVKYIINDRKDGLTKIKKIYETNI